MASRLAKNPRRLRFDKESRSDTGAIFSNAYQ